MTNFFRRLWRLHLGWWLALALVSSCCFFGGGCVSTAKLVQALASDTNSVSLKVTSPWGSVTLDRNPR